MLDTARKEYGLKHPISIIETEDSIYEYDFNCLNCSEAKYLFFILMCVSYTLSEDILEILTALSDDTNEMLEYQN